MDDDVIIGDGHEDRPGDDDEGGGAKRRDVIDERESPYSFDTRALSPGCVVKYYMNWGKLPNLGSAPEVLHEDALTEATLLHPLCAC